MKTWKSLVQACCIVFIFIIFTSFSYGTEINVDDTSNWMQKVDDQKYISELTIPGTHDSGSFGIKCHTVSIFAKCQKKNIEEQLEEGCRFLDIRLFQKGEDLSVYHGSVDCNLDFNKVMDDCVTFLKDHHSETILMSVKKEGEDKPIGTFMQTFLKYIQQDKYKNYWNLTTRLPRLNEARGKIILLRRFNCDTGEQPIGLDTSFEDNTTFCHDMGNNEFFYCEDLYKSTFRKKKNAIAEHIDSTKKNAGIQSNKNNLFMTFTSGYHIIPTPKVRAYRTNCWLEKNLDEDGRIMGIIVSDFPKDSIIQELINNNFISKGNYYISL